MAIFTGTAGTDTITPFELSSGVTADPETALPSEAADVINGLGMIAGTNHDSLWPVYRLSEGEEPPEPPEECPRDEVLAEVAEIEARCAEVRRLLGVERPG